MKDKDREYDFYEGNGNPITSIKQKRNDPCRCNSGKKAKNCCGCETEYFKHEKPTAENGTKNETV